MTNMKNIVIWALVIVNLFFLAFFLTGVISDSARRADSLRDLGALYSRNGIELDMDGIHEGALVAAFSTSRDEDGEQALAEALLGPTTRFAQGVNYTYTTADGRGQAEFKLGGDFDITPPPGAFQSGSDIVSEAKKLLKLMKIDAASIAVGPVDPTAADPAAAEGELVVAVAAWNNEPVYNCQITFTFKDGSLLRISGKRAAGIQMTQEKTDMSSPATALVSFLNYAKNEKLPCTAITSVEPGYTLKATSVPGYGSLSPVWRIDAEIDGLSEIYYVNTGTWKVEKA